MQVNARLTIRQIFFSFFGHNQSSVRFSFGVYFIGKQPNGSVHLSVFLLRQTHSLYSHLLRFFAIVNPCFLLKTNALMKLSEILSMVILDEDLLP